MTEEELKKAIRLLITWYDGEGDLVDGIVMLLREAGWKPAEEVKQRMKDILSEHPLASEYESDARYTWPERWIKLMEYFN